ncbi:MAG: hypothetical protein M3139_09830 [Bacteroidota bacterium]|nr:hypothetical protein [Bacteroidota bacterium]
MFFQKVLKGINGLPKEEAEQIVQVHGILSNWWRLKGTISNGEIKEECDRR